MYQHTQIGWMTVVGLAAAVVILFGTYNRIGPDVPGMEAGRAAMIILAMLIPVFGWLTITVDHEWVTASFGIGLIRKKIKINNIKAATQVRNKWWYGWGIRAFPDGWMYNVSGLDAVELELKSGSRFRIGTDEPEELLNSIRPKL